MTPADRDRSRTVLSRAIDEIRAKHDPNLALLQRAVENVVSLYDWHEAVGADVSTKIDWNRGARLNNVRDKAMAELEGMCSGSFESGIGDRRSCSGWRRSTLRGIFEVLTTSRLA